MIITIKKLQRSCSTGLWMWSFQIKFHGFCNKKLVTHGDSCLFFYFNLKILFASGDSYGHSLLTRWWLVYWSTELHYYWQNWLLKTPFSNQYFVLCLWHLITLSIPFGIDSMVLSITSVGKAKTVWIILFEVFLKVSLVRFLLIAFSQSFLSIRWKRFFIGIRSGECADMLNKQHPTYAIASLDILKFCKGSPSWRNNLSILFFPFKNISGICPSIKLTNFSPLILPLYC